MSRKQPCPDQVVSDLLAKCHRRCCICHKFCGVKIEVHHIVHASAGKPSTFENAIALCFDCHAEVGHYDNDQCHGADRCRDPGAEQPQRGTRRRSTGCPLRRWQEGLPLVAANDRHRGCRLTACPLRGEVGQVLVEARWVACGVSQSPRTTTTQPSRSRRQGRLPRQASRTHPGRPRTFAS